MARNSFIIASTCGMALISCLAVAQPVGISTLAGRPTAGTNDGAAANAQFNRPGGVAVDGSGNIFVADTANSTIRKISAAGIVSTFAGSPGNAGSSNGVGSNARFFAPQGLAVDNSGNVYVADTANSTIRKITSLGSVTTLAGAAGNPNSYNGIGTGAQFNLPQGVAVDGSGNVFVTDTWNHTIRKITPAGVVTTLAGLAGYPGCVDGTNSKARFNQPAGIALDGAANIYVADFLNHVIRKITPTGTVSTIAGTMGVWGNADGTNSGARFFQPQGISVNAAGQIFVVDSGNHTLRKITLSGTNWIVSTVAGSSGSAGDVDATGSAARFYFASAVASKGVNVVIADAGNNAIRTDILVPPTLQIARAGKQVVVSWPSFASSFTLETAGGVANPIWTPLTNGIAASGDFLVLTNAPNNSGALYRLHRP